MTPQQATVKLRRTMTLAQIAKVCKSNTSTIYEIQNGKPCMWVIGNRLIALAQAPKEKKK